MSVRRVVAAMLAIMLGAAVPGVVLGVPAASATDTPSADSAMTLSGKGEFANLKVTVSQTENLINQVVTITWQNATPPPPNVTGPFDVNFLQIMQCWGDDPAGPDRTQCQFGALPKAQTTTGFNVRTRNLTTGDPNEKLKLDVPRTNVPFWPVGRDKPNGAVQEVGTEFFDGLSTNEIPQAQTNADGTGLQFFEVQTARQAAGLGCGEPVPTGGVTTARQCWLVIVPRGTKEVDGTTRGPGTPNLRLDSSPLSQSNWDNRIVFPLKFVSVGQACPLGSPERRVVGHELALEAISRWQPALCAGGGALFNYSEVPDEVARNLVEGGQSPGLAFMTNPVPADQASPENPLVYAPVALSGLVIAFNIERHWDSFSKADRLLDGQRFSSMKLTPRLVAKLLTQSYQAAVAGYQNGLTPDYLKKNPSGLTRDPDFLELNPEYRGFNIGNVPPDGMIQLGSSDVTSLLWSWVTADKDASAFLAGTPDPYGMVVNPNNAKLTLPVSTFPRNDQSCVDVPTGIGFGKSCTLDIHPFFTDMHEAALSASRGDAGGRQPVEDQTGIVLKKDDRQLPGGRALIAVVDAPTAVRYSLPTASLLNASGKFVAPSTEGLLAGAAAMKPSGVPGVLAADPGAADPAAYPLTALSYAVASPSTLDARAGKDYAALVRHAAGPGQQPGVEPGRLPFGMAPLPEPLRAQALAGAATIEAQAGKSPNAAPSSQPVVPRTAAGDNTAGLSGGSRTATAPRGTVPSTSGVNSAPVASAGAPNPSGPAVQSPGVTTRPVGELRRTPPLPAPVWVGALLLAILICGVLAATSSPVLHSPVLHRLGAALRRRMRGGVMPTER